MSIVENLFEDPRHDLVTAFLLQVLITLILCKLFTKLLSFIGQPAVIGQILAGITLGPSGFGLIPGFSLFIFADYSIPSFQLVASLGLIFFMFYLGLKLDPNEFRQGYQQTLPVAFISIVIPFSIGCATSLWLYSMVSSDVSKISFILFIGSGIGFSAFPVLASILQSMDLITERIGVLTISIAAIEDIAVWVVLAVASAFSKGDSAVQGLYTLLLTLGFIVFMYLLISPLLSFVHRYFLRHNDEYNIYFIVTCLLVLVGASLFTEIINIHAFFGAFITGLIIPRRQKQGTIHSFLALRIELFIVEFFLPLYFTNSGLKTHLYLLNTGRAWYTLVSIVLIASISKILPVTLMTKLVTRKNENWSFALAVGILMNTRGIVQLAVLNIGVELGVLSPTIFAIFIAAAIIMTFTTSPLLHLIYQRRTKHMRKSDIPEKSTMTIQSIKTFRKFRLEHPSQNPLTSTIRCHIQRVPSGRPKITKLNAIMV